MSIAMVVLVGVLFGTGVYSMLHRTLTRVIVGVALIGNGTNLLIVIVGSRPGRAPIVGALDGATDAIPQALVLTAIVIGFALQAFLLALAWRNWTIDGNDDVEDDIEDRRVARERRERIRLDEAATRAQHDSQRAFNEGIR